MSAAFSLLQVLLEAQGKLPEAEANLRLALQGHKKVPITNSEGNTLKLRDATSWLIIVRSREGWGQELSRRGASSHAL